MKILNAFAILLSVVVLVGIGQMLNAPADVIELPVASLVVPASAIVPTVDMPDQPTPVEDVAMLNELPTPPNDQLAGIFRRDNSCDDGSCATQQPTPPNDNQEAPTVIEVDAAVPIATVAVAAGARVGKAVGRVVKVVRAVAGRERRMARRAARQE